jgi:glycolate oxidase FAD binding subunit
MNPRLGPSTIDELVEAVRSTPHLLPVGAQTKPRLSQVDATLLDTRRLKGITEYDSSEFTFTALAGTPLADISAALAERGQYLPFDPVLTRSGATLGGTVAAGLSGPGRFRYGGLRDFILGVQFVDGSGQLLRMGGKVVKNAAGFDLPKFLVGSLGRFGVLAELTFKVFPRPASLLTVKIPVDGAAAAVRIVMEASRARWELDTLDVSLTGRAVFMRLGGPSDANHALATEILTKWPGEVVTDADAWWSGVTEFTWASSRDVLLKVPLTPTRITRLVDDLPETARVHITAGGNSAWISLPTSDVTALDTKLRELRLSGLVLRGDSPLKLGDWPTTALADRVKAVLDPVNRFPPH